MADSTFRTQVEAFVRDQWLCRLIGQVFTKSTVALNTGGKFEFDAVSADNKILACISTNAGRTISMRGRSKKARPKLHKIRSDILYMLCSEAQRRLVILTDLNMYDLCMEEVNGGRMPQGIEFLLADVPNEMQDRLGREHYDGACEVTPGMRAREN
jgi:hypothetical protein